MPHKTAELAQIYRFPSNECFLGVPRRRINITGGGIGPTLISLFGDNIVGQVLQSQPAYYAYLSRFYLCFNDTIYFEVETCTLLFGLPANAKHRRTWKSGTYEMF